MNHDSGYNRDHIQEFTKHPNITHTKPLKFDGKLFINPVNILHCKNFHFYHFHNTLIFFSIDQLVCIHHNCDDSICVTGYEVCEENPMNAGREVGLHVCYVSYLPDNGTVTKVQYCFDDEHSGCTEECVLKLHGSFPLYDCCCTGQLCNDVEFNPTGVLFVYCICLIVCLFVCLSTTSLLHIYRGKEEWVKSMQCFRGEAIWTSIILCIVLSALQYVNNLFTKHCFIVIFCRQ